MACFMINMVYSNYYHLSHSKNKDNVLYFIYFNIYIYFFKGDRRTLTLSDMLSQSRDDSDSMDPRMAELILARFPLVPPPTGPPPSPTEPLEATEPLEPRKSWYFGLGRALGVEGSSSD